MKKIKALSLFSGGLDSILATRLIMAQGIEVEAVQFITPFFHYEVLQDIPKHRQRLWEKFGISVLFEDISDGYLQLLHNPSHGFGKNFNPCIDCKIMMLRRAKAMLAERDAHFLISGEVLGQRPMSQRRDAMNIIERDSGTRSLLLRPLCAQLMTETLPEREGWVDRSRLLAMSGRGRSAQMELARRFGITDYPAPAGGCVLADPILSRRIQQLYRSGPAGITGDITVPDVRSLLAGRQFLLPGGSWLVLGRDERENEKLEGLVQEGDTVLLMEQWPGPLGLLKKRPAQQSDEERESDLTHAAALVVRYGKQGKSGPAREVTCITAGDRRQLRVLPLADKVFVDWQMD